MVQTESGEALLVALEAMDPHEITKHDYCELMSHFQNWHTCQSPLAERAKVIFKRAYRFLQKELEKEKS